MKIISMERTAVILLMTILSIIQQTNSYRDIDTYDDQVEEIDTGSFDFEPNDQQNLNPTVQISCVFEREGSQICDCGYSNDEMVLPIFAGNINQIHLLNCKTLRVPENTFASLPHITWVRFNNIEELILEERGLAFPRETRHRVHLEIVNSVIEQINSHTITGNIEIIRFENVKIGVISPFAVTGIRYTLLQFNILQSSINRIEPQAFKKFNAEEFEIRNTTFATDMATRSFYEIEVTQKLRIENCRFTRIQANAFSFLEVSSFTLANNMFDQVNGEAFRMQVRESITIRNNDFGQISPTAFQTITLDNFYFTRNSEPMPFNFIVNYIDVMGGIQQLEFSDRFNMRIAQIYCKTAVTCDKVALIRNNEFLTRNADTIYFRIDDSVQGTKSQENEYHTFSYILNHRCIEESYMIYIIIGVVVVIVLLLLLLSIIICLCIRRRRARKFDVIRPEGKTYRETQIVMQVENSGLLKTDL